MYSYVYVLYNVCIPGIVKIGWTKDRIKDYIAKINVMRGAASVGNYQLGVCWRVALENGQKIAKNLYDKYDVLRVENGNSFFLLPNGNDVSTFCKKLEDEITQAGFIVNKVTLPPEYFSWTHIIPKTLVYPEDGLFDVLVYPNSTGKEQNISINFGGKIIEIEFVIAKSDPAKRMEAFFIGEAKKTKDTNGYVYALYNEFSPGVIKIGYAKNDPVRRAKTINKEGRICQVGEW